MDDLVAANAIELRRRLRTRIVFYCGERPLAFGEGLSGLHEPKLRELASEAGFGSVGRMEMENPFNSLYALRR